MKCPKCGHEIDGPIGINEAADFLGVSKRWLYNAYNNPEVTNLPARLVFPGKWLFELNDLEKWKEANKT